jgi:hypothetical protein
MDTNILESPIEAPLSSGHLQVDELGLGLYKPSKPQKVENMNKLWFHKAIGVIVQWKN